jgi:hypothetical protein
LIRRSPELETPWDVSSLDSLSRRIRLLDATL